MSKDIEKINDIIVEAVDNNIDLVSEGIAKKVERVEDSVVKDQETAKKVSEKMNDIIDVLVNTTAELCAGKVNGEDIGPERYKDSIMDVIKVTLESIEAQSEIVVNRVVEKTEMLKGEHDIDKSVMKQMNDETEKTMTNYIDTIADIVVEKMSDN